ncbi:MAG: hypothetical protein IMF11_20430 [Proteobacteria bacterium]|nr:hypothetical protein [Pseudomonadota bacterium]
MKKKTKHYFPFVVIVFAVLCWFSMDTPAAYGAYEALETNYQSKYNPDNYPATGNYQLVNMEVHNPGKSTFRVYIPQGATRADLRFYMGQDVKIGAAVRMGLHPECVYNINVDEYYDLPWGRYDGTSVAALYGKDFQARNLGGQIVILSSATVSAGGEWIYVKVLKYDSSDIGIVYLAVWVDAAQYKAWYDGYTGWDAQNNPSQTLSGSTGGYCNPVWAEGGAEGGGGDDTGGSGGYPLPDIPTPDPGDDPVDDDPVDDDPVDDDPVDDGTDQYSEGNNIYLSVDVGSGEGVVSKTFDSNGFSSMILKQVKMVFENPPQGLVHCYAAYLKDGDMYVAEKDLGGDIVFIRYRENDTLKSYADYTFSGSADTYYCTAFETLHEIRPAILSKHEVLFACVVLAEDGSVQGTVFGFDDLE